MKLTLQKPPFLNKRKLAKMDDYTTNFINYASTRRRYTDPALKRI